MFYALLKTTSLSKPPNLPVSAQQDFFPQPPPLPARCAGQSLICARDDERRDRVWSWMVSAKSRSCCAWVGVRAASSNCLRRPTQLFRRSRRRGAGGAKAQRRAAGHLLARRGHCQLLCRGHFCHRCVVLSAAVSLSCISHRSAVHELFSRAHFPFLPQPSAWAWASAAGLRRRHHRSRRL